MTKNKQTLNEITSFINDIAFISDSKYYYEPFCGSLDIVKNIRVKNRCCSDNNRCLIDIIKMGIHNSDLTLSLAINYIIKEHKETTDGKKAKKVVKVLRRMFSCQDLYEINSIEDVVRYNSKAHTERFDNKEWDAEMLSDISIECKEYKEVEPVENSIMLCYPPLLPKDIMKADFNYAELYEWIEEHSKNNIVLLLASEANSKFEQVFNCINDNKLKMFAIKGSMADNILNMY